MNSVLREAVQRKRSLQEQQESIMTAHLEAFEMKGKDLAHAKRKQKELSEMLIRIQNENEELKKKNEYTLKEVNEAGVKNQEVTKETENIKDKLLESQTYVSKICAQESAEIHKIQDERDRQLKVFDESM
jgi:hypothetical protein